MGFIGQEAAGVIPEVVTISNDSYSMQYAPITALLVEAVKAQQDIIESQNKKLDRQQQLIEVQQAEFEKLRTEIEALKAIIMNGNK
ncbi:MAG: hypothetical protein RBS37_09105 [Bacteroidales bacterium]|jgi:heme exporter protein D|nr:hypothetical protein [Bacteroidales bacterium]